jgi:CheY-like chemotaxis protein
MVSAMTTMQKYSTGRMDKPSVQTILEALSDNKDLFIFDSIDRTGINIRSVKAHFTRKQFYSRLSKLSNAHLINGKRGYYRLTSLGVLVHELLRTLEDSICEFDSLKAIDDTPELLEEGIKQIDRMIDNQAVKKILTQGFSRYDVNTNTMNRSVDKKRQRHLNYIMLVDDDTDILLTYKTILMAAGYTVECYSDSYEALKHFVQNPDWYEIVICDIRLPRLNGIKLCEKLTSLKADLKVLFVTALDAVDEIRSAIKGMDFITILKKPIDGDDLVNTIDTNLLQQRHLYSYYISLPKH